MESYESPSGIKVSLSDLKTWKQFYPNTEMIVTKKKGRVIFPHLVYKIKGLEPTAHYEVFIHLERADGIKYKFENGKWEEVGKGDPILPTIQYRQHPDGARPGSHWTNEAVSFSHLKITNDPENTDPKLILVQSMHKFRPVLTIKRNGNGIVEEFRLPITEFYAVTAYQNHSIIKLKVANNKFASGFRSGKRKNSFDSDDTSPSDKRRSTSSSSDSSTSSPLGLSPPSPWDTSLSSMSPLNPVDPIMFHQNQIMNSTQPIQMQHQFPYFPGAPLNQYHPGHWNPMYWAQWNSASQAEAFTQLKIKTDPENTDPNESQQFTDLKDFNPNQFNPTTGF